MENFDYYYNEYKQNNNLEARNTIILNHKALIQRIIYDNFRWIYNPNHIEEITQEGYIALIQILDEYDPNYEYDFTKFAGYRLFQKLLRYIQKHYFPTSSLRANYLKTTYIHLQEKHNNTLSVEEAAKILNVTLPSLKKCLLFTNDNISLNKQIYTDNDKISLEETISDKVSAEDVVFNKYYKYEELYEALNELSERDRELIQYTYGINRPQLTLNEIAQLFDYTYDSAKQLRTVAKKKLKQILLKKLA